MRVVEERRRNHHLCSRGGVSSGNVNCGSEGGNFEFMCVGKEMRAVLFFVHLFQGLVVA